MCLRVSKVHLVIPNMKSWAKYFTVRYVDFEVRWLLFWWEKQFISHPHRSYSLLLLLLLSLIRYVRGSSFQGTVWTSSWQHSTKCMGTHSKVWSLFLYVVTFPLQELDDCLLIFRDPHLVIHCSMSAVKAVSLCLNLVCIPIIGIVISGPASNSWLSEFPANWALKSNFDTFICFSWVYLGGTYHAWCAMSFQLVNHPYFWDIHWLISFFMNFL